MYYKYNYIFSGMDTINNAVNNDEKNIFDTQKYILNGGEGEGESEEKTDVVLEENMLLEDDGESFVIDIDDELVFDASILENNLTIDFSEETNLQILGDAYDVEVEYVKKTWDVVYNKDDVRRDLIDEYEEALLQDTGRKELSANQKYNILDKANQVIDFVNSYDQNQVTKGRKESISGQNKPTNMPSVSVLKKSFGETNTMYRMADTDFVDKKLYNGILYDLLDNKPVVQQYQHGKFVKNWLKPIVKDRKKLYTDTFEKKSKLMGELEDVDEGKEETKSEIANSNSVNVSLLDQFNKISAENPESYLSKYKVYHPKINSDKYQQNGMSLNEFEKKKSKLEMPYETKTDLGFTLNAKNKSYWANNDNFSSYSVVRDCPASGGDLCNFYYSPDNVKIQERMVLGNQYRLDDIFRDVSKTTSIRQACIGTIDDEAYVEKQKMIDIKSGAEFNNFNLPIDEPPKKVDYIDGELLDIRGYFMLSPNLYSLYNLKTPKVNINDIKKDSMKKQPHDYIYYKSPIDYENLKNKTNKQAQWVNYLVKLNDEIKLEIKDGVEENVVDRLKSDEFYYDSLSKTIFKYKKNYHKGKLYDGISYYCNQDDDFKVISTNRKPFKLDKKVISVKRLNKDILKILLSLKSIVYPEIYSKLFGKVGELNINDKIKVDDLVYINTTDINYNLGYVEKIYESWHKVPKNTFRAGKRFKLVVRPISDYYFKENGYLYLEGNTDEYREVIKIDEHKTGYFYDLLNNKDVDVVDFHFKSFKLWENNRFERNTMYVFEDLVKFKQIAKEKHKISEKQLHKMVLDWVNLEAYEVLDITLYESIKSMDKSDEITKFNDEEIKNWDNIETVLSKYGLQLNNLCYGQTSQLINDYFEEYQSKLVNWIKNQNQRSLEFTTNFEKIREQFNKQDKEFYKKIIDYKIKIGEFNEKNKKQFIKSIKKYCDGIPNFILSNYLDNKNVDSIEELMENTIENIQENYIVTLYQLYNYSRGIHKNYSKLINTGDPKVIKLSTHMFEFYKNFPEHFIDNEKYTISPSNNIEDLVYNWIKNSNDRGDYYYNILNYFNVLNYKKLNISNTTKTAQKSSKQHLQRLEKQYNYYKRIYEDERDLNKILMETCNRVEVVKIYNSEEELEKDNNKEELFIDVAFETIDRDIEILEMIDDYRTMEKEALKTEFMASMKKFYPFKSEHNLDVMIETVLENKDNMISSGTAYRKVRDGDYCMMITLESKIFYKRVRDIWIVQDMKAITNNVCNTDFLNVIDKSTEDIIEAFKNQETCLETENVAACLPEKLLLWASEMVNIKESIDLLKHKNKEISEIDEVITNYQNKIKHNIRYNKLKNARNQYFRRQLLLKKSTVKKVKNCPFTNLVNSIKQLDDQEEMLKGLRDMIEEYDTTDVLEDEDDDNEEIMMGDKLLSVDIDDDSELNQADIDYGGHTSSRKEYLFRAEKPEHIEQLKMDKVAEYSVSDSVLANQMTKLIKKDLSEYLTENEVVICDGMSCVGGNTMSFSREFKKVITNEFNKERYGMLEHNCRDVLKLKNIDYYNEDILKLDALDDCNVLFLDPEWGGKGSKSDRLKIGDKFLDKFIEEVFTHNKKMRMISLKLPYLYNLETLNSFKTEFGYKQNIYYLGENDNVILVTILKEDLDKKEGAIKPSNIKNDTFLYWSDSVDKLGSKVCKHYQSMFRIIGKTEEEKENIMGQIFSEWGILHDTDWVCASCGEILGTHTQEMQQHTTREGRSTVTRELVYSGFKNKPVFNKDDIEWDTSDVPMIKDQYEIISSFTRLSKLTLSKQHYDKLLKDGEKYQVILPSNILNISKAMSSAETTQLYMDTGKDEYKLSPFTKINSKGFQKLMVDICKKPKTFKEFITRWNEYIKTKAFKDKPTQQNKFLFVEKVKTMAELEASIINKNEKFHVSDINDFINKWKSKPSGKSHKLHQLLWIFANLLVVYNHKYYSNLIYKLLARILLLTQTDDVYSQDKTMWFGFPMNSKILGSGKDLPDRYIRKDSDGNINELETLEMMAEKVKSLAVQTDNYPWSVLKWVNNETIVKYIKLEVLKMINDEKLSEIKNKLTKKVEEIKRIDKIYIKYKDWEAFKPKLMLHDNRGNVIKPTQINPNEFNSTVDISKLSVTELSRYQTLVSKNILYLVNQSIKNENLTYGNRLNNACCLSNVQHGLENLSFYFTYFMDKSTKDKKLMKLLDISQRLDKQNQMISNEYSKVSFNVEKTKSRRLLDYMEQDFMEKVVIAGKTYPLRNISMKNNIFLNYCYNKSSFGQRRIFKTRIDNDIYLLHKIKKELYENSEDEDVSDKQIREALFKELDNKYNKILSRADIERKMIFLMNFNGKVETCVLSGITKYDIIKNIKDLIKSGDGKLETLATKLNQKIRLNNIINSSIKKPSKVHYTPYSWRDDMEDSLNKLNFMELYMPKMEILDGIKEIFTNILKKNSSWLSKSVNTFIPLKDFDMSIVNETIISIGSIKRDILQDLLTKYSPKKIDLGEISRMIGNRDNFVEIERKTKIIELRTFGYSEDEIKEIISNDRKLLENDQALIGIRSVNNTILLLKKYISIIRNSTDKTKTLSQFMESISLNLEQKNHLSELLKDKTFITKFLRTVKSIDFPSDIIEYLLMEEYSINCNELEKRFLFGYQNQKQFLKVILMELLISMYQTETEDSVTSEYIDEYNSKVTYFITNLVFQHQDMQNSIESIDTDEINKIKNILSSRRNENRKSHHEALDKDSKLAKKAYRAIGMGVEFNEMHDFKTTINIDNSVFGDKDEYTVDFDEGDEAMDGKFGISGFVGGEDYNDELDY